MESKDDAGSESHIRMKKRLSLIYDDSKKDLKHFAPDAEKTKKVSKKHKKEHSNKIPYDHVQEHEDNDLERKRQENIERVFKRKSTPENLTTLLKETGNLPNKETLDNWVNEFHKEGLFTEQEILNAFKLYDEDGNGYITREE